MKKRIFGIILCASLLLSSMNVFAGSAIKWFDKNIAYLTASNGYITASTDVVESGIPKIHLRVLGLQHIRYKYIIIAVMYLIPLHPAVQVQNHITMWDQIVHILPQHIVEL